MFFEITDMRNSLVELILIAGIAWTIVQSGVLTAIRTYGINEKEIIP